MVLVGGSDVLTSAEQAISLMNLCPMSDKGEMSTANVTSFRSCKGLSCPSRLTT